VARFIILFADVGMIRVLLRGKTPIAGGLTGVRSAKSFA
jgi:hypothetical protein